MRSMWVLAATLLIIASCSTPDGEQSAAPSETALAPTTSSHPMATLPVSTTLATVTTTTTMATFTSSTPTTTLPVSTTLATATTTTRNEVPDGNPQIVLRGDGLGIVGVGESMTLALTILTDALGPPSDDFVAQAPWDTHGDFPTKVGACNAATGHFCFEYARFVYWERFDLFAVFSDAVPNDNASPGDDDYWLQVEPRLGGYTYGGGEAALLATPQGITIGTTAAELSAIYGESVNFSWGCGFPVRFTVTTPTGLIWGGFFADPWPEPSNIDPSAEIEGIGAGPNSMTTC